MAVIQHSLRLDRAGAEREEDWTHHRQQIKNGVPPVLCRVCEADQRDGGREDVKEQHLHSGSVKSF